MWKIAYNVLLIIILPFFLLFSLAKQKIRKTLGERLLPQPLDQGKKNLFWIHAASVGEAVIAENIVNYMNDRENKETFLLTTNTYYTRDLLRKKWNGKIPVYSLPFDLSFSLKRFMGGADLKVLVIVETELWPNLIWLARERGMPVVIINGRISDRTFARYKKLASFMKNVFSGINLVLAQSEEHRQRFISIGMPPEKVQCPGNLKYFRQIEENKAGMPKGKIITFGSIKEKEIEPIIAVVKRLKRELPDHLMFVAPRELNLVVPLEEHFASCFDVMRYSVYRDIPDAEPSIVVVDTVGDLLSIYGKSRIAFVGGSLAPYGGQNMLEPLFFGTPVVFGPHVENFGEIAEKIVLRGAGVMVETEETLFDQMMKILKDEDLNRKMGSQGIKIILEQQQVMEQTVNAVVEVAWKSSQN